MRLETTILTLSWPISLHSHKPPGPHCFEPFTCNVYRSFQPQNMHMCKQFLGKDSTAEMFFENQTYLWFVWFFLQNENELKIKEIFLPWKAKHTGKDCSSIACTRWRAAAASQLHRRTRYRAAAASHAINTLWPRAPNTFCVTWLQINISQKIFNTTHYSIIRHRKGHCIRFRMIPLSTREGLGTKKSYGRSE